MNIASFTATPIGEIVVAPRVPSSSSRRFDAAVHARGINVGLLAGRVDRLVRAGLGVMGSIGTSVWAA